MAELNNHSNVNRLHTTTPKNGYKVTPEAAAILDCLRATQEMYAQICDALEPLYNDDIDADALDTATAPYLELINDIDELLHEELTRRICDSISDVKNSHNTDVITL